MSQEVSGTSPEETPCGEETLQDPTLGECPPEGISGSGETFQDSLAENYGLDWNALRKYFRFQEETWTIIAGVESFLKENEATLRQYPFLVGPFPFTFAVRQQEAGKPGREFGIMHPEAIDTDLETQLEWFLWTLLKDTVRWHTANLWQGWRKEEFKDFIAYFAKKYAPTGAVNDPQGLNRFWEHNVRYYYELFRAKGVS